MRPPPSTTNEPLPCPLPAENPVSRPPTPNYNGTVIITSQDNSFYSVSFRDLEFKILGITGAEKVLDAVKDFVENGEVWV